VAEVRGVLGVRHPDDPEPVESTKIVAARMLAGVAVALSPFVGGVVPALIALMLARQAEADIRASEGFLLGASRLPLIRRLAWTAVGIASAVVVAALLVWVITLAREAGGPSYGGAVAGSG
jgi:(hydroxyamino)benzene mutase